ncbi:DUF4123 domain-containing protein [Ralstonia flaminis]|jgi:hypothetical protein|uniref:DUF4123 domain-containing protein n=2 Tax=Ralstonia TaxID=48736 RepID=A0ABN9JRX8_9RALS|nr:DUF4123 domain-containing protein [Ralstonia sp. LMG 18101]CAJ0820922.1 hypothetical protein LMG18101_04450 [Ralstonia sp. LMG 18101]
MTDPLQTQAAEISHALHSEVNARPQADCMLLIDTVPRPISEDDALWEGYSQSDNVRVKLAHPKIDPAHYPALLPLSITKFKDSLFLEQSVLSALEELPSEILRTGTGRRIAGWLTSSEPISKVARHLASSMLQYSTLRGGVAWLRLQDPAVLWWLWSLLSPVQRKALLGPIEIFWLLNPAGRLIELRAESVEAKDAQAVLALSSEQWKDVACIAPLNLAIREWGQAQVVGARFDSLCASALAAVRRACAAGFTDQRDLAAYARCALEIHPEFDLHALVRARLAQRGEDDYFTSLIDDLEEQDWQRIANESSVTAVD